MPIPRHSRAGGNPEGRGNITVHHSKIMAITVQTPSSRAAHIHSATQLLLFRVPSVIPAQAGIQRGEETSWFIIPKSWPSRFKHRPAGQGSAYPLSFRSSVIPRPIGHSCEGRNPEGRGNIMVHHSKIMSIMVQTPSSRESHIRPAHTPRILLFRVPSVIPAQAGIHRGEWTGITAIISNHGNHGSNTVQQGRGEHTSFAPRKGPRGKLHQINVQPPLTPHIVFLLHLDLCNLVFRTRRHQPIPDHQIFLAATCRNCRYHFLKTSSIKVMHNSKP